MSARPEKGNRTELFSPQSVIVLPRKNRLRIYVDTEDKYYRLRELKRGLADVVVKVRPFPLCASARS